DWLGHRIGQLGSALGAARVVAVNYPALEVCDVFSLGSAIGVESPNVERIDIGGIGRPPMRRLAVRSGIGAVEIDADRNRPPAGTSVRRAFESEQRLEEHRRFGRWIVGERRDGQLAGRVMFRDGAEMIQ